MKIDDVCNRHLIVADETASLEEAIKLMRQYHVGVLVVTREVSGRRQPVGIITDRDILVRVLGEELPLDAVDVADVMSTELIVGHSGEPVFHGIRRMREHGVRRLPVVNGHNELIGILSVDDVIEVIAGELSDLAALIRREQVEERRRTVSAR